MKTFSIQLVFTYICLSNANYYGENDVKVQRQMPFEPRNDTTWDGIMDSVDTFWSNQNLSQRQKAKTHDSFDCSDLPQSMNGQDFDSGCPGAVYQDGSPSYRFCNGIGYNGKYYPWWKQCCFWKDYKCQPKFSCPTERSNSTSAFREIKGKCYHITKGGCHHVYYGCTFQQAQDQCKTVFGSGISGYIFEPTTLEVNNAVLKAAEDVMGHSRWFWIGVTNGDFRYRSNGKPLSIEPIPFGSDQPSLPSSDTQCIGAVSGTMKWFTTYCWKHLYTICETSFYLPMYAPMYES